MDITKIKGLKFPDEFFIRFFFKNKLNTKKLKYIEFGCGNGNNLLLPYEYGNEIIGIDYNKDAIEMAKYNFSLLKGKYKFYNADMRNFVKEKKIFSLI